MNFVDELQAVQRDAALQAPLNEDLLDLTRAFLTSKLQSVSKSSCEETVLLETCCRSDLVYIGVARLLPPLIAHLPASSTGRVWSRWQPVRGSGISSR